MIQRVMSKGFASWDSFGEQIHRISESAVSGR